MEASIQILKSNAIIVYKPGEQEYERCVATANLRFRFSRPDFVVLPKNAAHVQSIIKQARAEGLKITIKSGGHSSAGYSTAFQGVSLDLKEMNSAQLDLASRAVTVDAGCQWGHVYKELVNGRHNGLMVNGGRCPFVGVSGFTLGGGLGPFTRTLGLGSDSLLEATIVTADGNLVTVKDTHSPKSKEGKLFWALRGAGGGNFGVVVQMKLKVHELSGEGDEKGIVVAGRYQWFPPETSKETMVSEEMVSTMNDFYTTDWPNRMTIDSTWMCDLRQSRDGIRFLTYFDGTEKEFDKIIDDNIKHRVLQTQLKRRTLPEKSTRFLHETLVAQWSEETVRAFPTNKTYSIYSSFVFKNDRIDIEQITAIIHAAMIKFRKDFSGERVEFLASFIHAGGKASEVKPEATAFFWREATYYMYLTLEWEDKWMEGDMWEFLGNIKQRLRPFSLKRAGAYINFADPALEKDAYERAYYGDNHYALQRVKQIWDKDNFFDWEQGVRLPDESNSESLSVVDFANDRKFTDVLASQGWESYQTKKITGALQSLADLGL